MVQDEKIIEGIRKTGFDLEYRMSEVLRASAWNVINNRYYIDDQQEKVREIDLVAYKARQLDDFSVYTTLIVSCKKSEDNAWVFLSKDLAPNDPNFDWRPLHLWTNNPALEFMASQTEWRDSYFAALESLGSSETFRVPRAQIFAFQEMNKNKWTAQNDRPIFESITSLMKAQAYELGSLSQRRKESAVYQFNLLSIVDSDLFGIHFHGEERKVDRLDQTWYVANYIVQRRHTFARIHFVRARVFDQVLKEYDLLHQANCTAFRDTFKNFYTEILKDRKRVKVFEKDFVKAIERTLAWRITKKFKASTDLSIWLSWNEEANLATLDLVAEEEVINYLNSDDEARNGVKDALRKYYRYDGDFQFAAFPF